MLANALLPAQGRRQLERGLGAAGPRESQRAESQGLPGGGVSAAPAGAGRGPARRRSAGWGEGCPGGGGECPAAEQRLLCRVPARGHGLFLGPPRCAAALASRSWPRCSGSPRGASREVSRDPRPSAGRVGWLRAKALSFAAA